MKKSIVVALCAAVFCISLTVSACAGLTEWSNQHLTHYRTTITVETPEGDKVGFAVREVGWVKGFRTPEACGVCTGLYKGEAVVVDLGARGQVYGLLSGPKYGADYAKSVFFDNFAMFDGKGAVELPPELYPTFVRFRDPKDPKSVERLIEFEPYTPPGASPSDGHYRIKADHFEEAFGQGVHLKSVTIEVTEDPVQMGQVNKYLKWFAAVKMVYLNGQTHSRGAPLGLMGGDFQKGNE